MTEARGATPASDHLARSSAKNERTDIQLLRAWAVLSVVLNHAGLPFLPGGFLGVDIFFVISGYLMTRLIDTALMDRSFTFGGFAARRVRRLLPAAYATLAVTAIAAPFLLDATEYRSFAGQLAGAFTFTANFVLWRQADYFGTGATMKPLLHLWSLSLEEQYYLVIPLLLFLSPRRWRLPVTVALVAISAVVCALLMQRSVSAAFYLLPSRAWELAIGSVVAMLVQTSIVRAVPMAWLRLPCAVVILVVPLFAGEVGHPGWAAVAVCLATAILLVPGAVLGRGEPLLRPLVAIGDRSYSLYLVHWPLLAFAANIFVGPVPLWINLALLALGAIWAEGQYRLVEQPLRHFRMTRRSLTALFLLPALLIGTTWGLASAMAGPDTQARVDGAGLSTACDYRGDFVEQPKCRTGTAPHTLLWGDSFAMALAPGMAVSSPSGIVQATRTVCGPFLGLSPMDHILYTRAWGERCISFNDSVFAWLAAHPEVDTVVLSSVLETYVPGADPGPWRVLVRTSRGLSEQPRDIETLAAALQQTATRVRALGKRVVLVAPPPSSGDDVARCLERIDQDKPTFTRHADCSFTVAEYLHHRSAIRNFLALVRARGIVPVVDFDARLCGTGTCQTRLGSTILYRDKGHLSGPGSILLGREMHWGTVIAQSAR